MNYSLFTKIEDKSQIAVFFNHVMRNLQMYRTTCAPRSFMLDASIAAFQDKAFCDFCRYETWMHGVVEQLVSWNNAIEQYFSEFCGSWKYYAATKRIDHMKECGACYGYKTTNIPDEEYRRFSIVNELGEDGCEIVLSTVPDDLKEFCAYITAASQMDIFQEMKDFFGTRFDVYKKNKDGDMVPLTQEEHEENKALVQVQADDDIVRVRAIAGVICGIGKMIEACRYNEDNKELLTMILNSSKGLLNMDFSALGLLMSDFREKYTDEKG